MEVKTFFTGEKLKLFGVEDAVESGRKRQVRKMREIQEDWLGTDLETRGVRWETLQARVTPEEKRDIFLYCKTVVKLPFSVVTRLIWRRILSNYRRMPQIQGDSVQEVNKATDEVLDYIPIIRKQRHYAPNKY